MAIRADKTEALQALEAELARLVPLLRETRDETAPAIGKWTVKHVAAHLAAGSELLARYAEGRSTPGHSVENRGDFNDTSLVPYLDRPMPELADLLEERAGRTLEAVRAIEGDADIGWMSGIQIPVSSLVAITMTEVMMHGYDVAHAVGAPWPLAPAHCRVAILGLVPSLPYFVEPEAARGFSGTFELRLRGDGRFRLTFGDGILRVQEPDGSRADCYLSLDPVAYVMVAYGRSSQWGAIAKGKMVTWGRKPWLSLKLPTLLQNP